MAPTLAMQSPDLADLRAAGLNPERAGRIARAMESLVAQRRLPGLALRVARRGTVLDWAVGHHTTANSPATSAATVMRLYSATKPMTSAVLFSFFEEGRWLFSDPVTRFLPELADIKVAGTGKPPQRPITMSDLLTHSAGFAYGIGGLHEVDQLYAQARVLDYAQPVQTLLARVAALPLVQEPGTGSHYSVAHDLQGLIAERLGGEPLDVLMQQRLFGPAGMQTASFGLQPHQLANFAPVHRHGADGHCQPVDIDPAEPFAWQVSPAPRLISGGGGVLGTLDDEYRFLRLIAGRGSIDGTRVLAPATVKLMTSAALVSQQPGAAHTPGWFTLITDPVPSGSCASPGTLFTGGAGGNWGWIDGPRDLIVVGMMSVLNWFDASDTPSWMFDPLIYQALED
jgi:CubicO group peptidase (beta-lactamase class C family)